MGRYEQFRVFHLANPEVFELFEKFSRQAKYEGNRKRLGIVIG